MSEDITIHDLEKLAAGINRQITGYERSYSKDSKGRTQHHVGAYVLEFCSMGASLRRVKSISGLTTPVTMPSNFRKTFDLLMAFYQGFLAGKEQNQ
tara:strand:- start:62 stop:349 length:288 start_codon:yes stop_codon:yes gene_type:complete